MSRTANFVTFPRTFFGNGNPVSRPTRIRPPRSIRTSGADAEVMEPMRNSRVLVALACLSFPACGSGANDPSSGTGAFNPGPAAEGYTRLTAQTIHGVKPGDDVTFCQYLMAPFDHDVDVLDVEGAQSKFGHHAVAFSLPDASSQVLGTNLQCMGTEYTAGTDGGGFNNLSMGAFLGGVGGKDAGGAVKLPDGVAFRLKAGNGIMLNLHYLNTGTETVDGDAVVDIKFADADPNRKIVPCS